MFNKHQQTKESIYIDQAGQSVSQPCHQAVYQNYSSSVLKQSVKARTLCSLQETEGKLLSHSLIYILTSALVRTKVIRLEPTVLEV